MNMASWLTLADIGLARPSYGSYCRCVSVVSVTVSSRHAGCGKVCVGEMVRLILGIIVVVKDLNKYCKVVQTIKSHRKAEERS